MKAAGQFLAMIAFLGLGTITAAGQAASAPAESKTRGSLVEQTFHLNNVGQASDMNEIVTAIRNIIPPSAKVYPIVSQNAFVVQVTADELAQVEKLLKELDQPKKSYRLTYTMTEMDSGKQIGVLHYSMIVIGGQRTVMKQGSKVPVVTGSSPTSSAQNSQVQYLDIGINLDATLDEFVNGVRLRTKVEQLAVAEERSGVGVQDPVIRQTSLEGTSLLTPGKPLILGSVDVPGSTRHFDVEVVMELVK